MEGPVVAAILGGALLVGGAAFVLARRPSGPPPLPVHTPAAASDPLARDLPAAAFRDALLAALRDFASGARGEQFCTAEKTFGPCICTQAPARDAGASDAVSADR